MLLLGCSGGASYTVGGQTLSVKASGYKTAIGADYCEAASPGQLQLLIVDYSPLCGANYPTDGGSEAGLERNELELIYVTSAITNSANPLPVTNADCVNGPAADAIATFHHWDSNATTSIDTPAQGGEMYLSYVDPSGAKPAKGKFTLEFGDAGTIHGDFESPECM